MPRFYHGLDDAGRAVRDRLGIDLPNLDHARGRALRMLRVLSEGAEPERESIIARLVRGEDGSLAHGITMAVEGGGDPGIRWEPSFARAFPSPMGPAAVASPRSWREASPL